ncbi:MAG: hypothetical protein CVU59_02770, partial [Deltaproteobacteria bacterium HGW-Deltaproteobacteria-17]
MLRRVHLYSLAFAMLWISACGPDKQEDPGWLPRTESAAAIRDYHHALATLARTSPAEACRLGFFGIGELILAAQELIPGHQAQLFGNFGIACDNPRVNPDCAARLFEVLHETFAACAAVSPETAAWGRRFLRWQGRLKESWDREHFEEAVALLGSPMERLTRVEDYRYYTLDNHLVFRTAAFLRKLLADTRRDPHPLSVWHWEKLARADVAWERLELPLFPALPTDDGADTDVPSYSKAAVENIVWPVIRMDPFGAAEA